MRRGLILYRFSMACYNLANWACCPFFVSGLCIFLLLPALDFAYGAKRVVDCVHGLNGFVFKWRLLDLFCRESQLMDVSTIVKTTVSALGFELVDFERGGGMLRVYIDKSVGITVEDCAAVSNQLTRVFMVENIDFERLEVSSPGLDRPLKTIADFEKFIGVRVKVRLHQAVDARKRFDGAVLAVDGDKITFNLAEDLASATGSAGSKIKVKKKVAIKAKVDAKALTENVKEQVAEKKITVALGDIERARLIPDI